MLSFQIVVGNTKCNARCPFCISKQTTTPQENKMLCPPEVNWPNFHKAIWIGKAHGVISAVLTGKGEPTLFPTQISEYLRQLCRFDIPLIDLQTNGTLFSHSLYQDKAFLNEWYGLGLTTIAISVISINEKENQKIYFDDQIEYPSLVNTVELLREYGYMIRLSVVGLKGYVDDAYKLKEIIEFCREYDVKQLSWKPEYTWKEGKMAEAYIREYVRNNGVLLRCFPGNGEVYDLDGQNVCLNQCLDDIDPNADYRNLIFFPNGDVYTHWDYPGSIIMQGK